MTRAAASAWAGILLATPNSAATEGPKRVATTPQCKGIPLSIARLLGAMLLAELFLCAGCGAPAGNDNVQSGAETGAGQLAADRTIDIYGNALMEAKRDANSNAVKMVIQPNLVFVGFEPASGAA